MNRRDLIISTAAVTFGAALSTALPRAGRAEPANTPGLFHFSVMMWTIAPKLGFEPALEAVHAAGYQGAELVGEYRKWDDATIRSYLTRMRSWGLSFDSMAGVETGFATPGAADALCREVEGLLPTADKLECPQIILLSGPRAPNTSREQQHAASIENLKRLADVAQKHKVEFVIEPIDVLENPTIYLTSVAEAFEIARAVDSPQVRVLYDFYHEQRGAGNLIEKLDGNIDLISLVHIADVPGRHEPGSGEIDYRNIYHKLSQLGYKKFVAMEFYPSGDPRAMLEKARLDAVAAASAART